MLSVFNRFVPSEFLKKGVYHAYVLQPFNIEMMVMVSLLVCQKLSSRLSLYNT